MEARQGPPLHGGFEVRPPPQLTSSPFAPKLLGVAKLTPRQAAFVREYLVDLNGKQAAIRAGYGEASAEAAASRLLRVVKVKAEIDAKIAARASRIEVKADEVLAELKRVALCDVRQAFDEEGRLK